MKNISVIFLIIFLILANITSAQYAVDDHWYDNPLGFYPLNLHTSMGFIVPAIAVGICLLVTDKDPNQPPKRSVYNETGLSWGYKYPHTFLPQNNTGITFELRRFMAVGIEFDIYFPRDDFNRTTGLAIRPFARFYFVNNKKGTLYFESGGGLIYLFEEFPKPTDQDDRLGTYWNGTTKYGIGAEVKFNQATTFMFGMRHVHISNGDTLGSERNPSHDSNGIFMGFSRNL